MEPRRLGHGCEGVEAIELVTSEAKLIRAIKNREPGILLGGPRRRIRFFGVVTRYHLKLQTLPKAMHGCSYFYPIEEAATVAGGWSGSPGVSRPASSSVRTVRRRA